MLNLGSETAGLYLCPSGALFLRFFFIVVMTLHMNVLKSESRENTYGWCTFSGARLLKVNMAS